MKKISLKTIYLIIVLIFSLESNIFAQKNHEPIIVEKIGYAKTRDAALEKAIRKWNGSDAPSEVRYYYNKVDLNGDGKLDAIVFASGSGICGSGGCAILIFRGAQNDYRLITAMSVSRPPLIVLTSKTKGWNDLAMRVSGGGIKPYYSLLKFDGKSYPDNPTVEPEISGKTSISGVEYLSGIKSYDTGFLLK